MALSCAVCSTETITGIRCGTGVLCPRCASAHETASQSRVPARTIGSIKLDPIDGILSRRELDGIVEGREAYVMRHEDCDIQSARLYIISALVLLLATPATCYLAWHGMRTFAYAITTLMVLSLGEKAFQLIELWGRRRRFVIAELEGEGAYRRYRQLREDMKHLDVTKQKLLRRQILPKLRAMMEEKLPYLMQRRFEFASFLRSYKLTDLQAEVAALETRHASETDAEIREALQKRLALARSRRDHYVKLERRMRLYQIHLANLEAHMENLVARVVMLDPNDDFRSATESLMQGLTEEVEVLEEAYQETGK